ncbi:MAG: hypothetical protein Q7S63_01080 [bacterium]|nr:hypothetical protein [bacterium]
MASFQSLNQEFQGKKEGQWQEWFCRVCGTRGQVAYKEGEDAFSVIYRVQDHHGKFSPHCSLESVQVVNQALITPQEEHEISQLTYVGTLSRTAFA